MGLGDSREEIFFLKSSLRMLSIVFHLTLGLVSCGICASTLVSVTEVWGFSIDSPIYSNKNWYFFTRCYKGHNSCPNSGQWLKVKSYLRKGPCVAGRQGRWSVVMDTLYPLVSLTTFTPVFGRCHTLLTQLLPISQIPSAASWGLFLRFSIPEPPVLNQNC